MAGHHYDTVFDVVTGRPVVGVTVEVYQAGATISGDSVTSGTYATIYSDDGVTTIDQSSSANWVTTDSRGYYEFWTDDSSVVLAFKYNGTAMDAIDDVEIVGGDISGDVTALAARVDKHDTVFGLSASATDLGTFTGSVITDNDDVVGALQALETAVQGGSGGYYCEQFACSDESTAITSTGTKLTFRIPAAVTLTAVRASLNSACTTGTFTVDINESGTTILSTKLTIDATEKTSTTAATAAVISDASIADDAEITIDVDDVGDSTATGLKVTLIGTYA